MRADQNLEGSVCSPENQSSVCENIHDAARDAWSTGSCFDKRTNSDSARLANVSDQGSLNLTDLWKEFSTANGGLSGQAGRLLSELELHAGEGELSLARQSLINGDMLSASRRMDQADFWLGRAEKDSFNARQGTEDSAPVNPGGEIGKPSVSPGDSQPAIGQPNQGQPELPPSNSENPSSDSVQASGQFTQENRFIYDRTGKLFQPRGIAVDDPDLALADIDKIANDWRVNTIRIAPWDWSTGTPSQDFEKMQKVVDEYTKRGIVVEITDAMPNRSGSIMQGDELAAHAAWYSQLASRFKDNPYVWLATPNEQGANNMSAAQDSAWLNEQLTIDRAIRNTGNRNTIVQGDANWGQGAMFDGHSALLEHADQFKDFGNIIAGEHVYNNNDDAYQRLTNEVKNLRDQGFAVTVDEFGDGNWIGGQMVSAKQGADAVFKAVDELGIGAQVFEWKDAGGDGSDSLTTGGRGNGALTNFGQMVWKITHTR